MVVRAIAGLLGVVGTAVGYMAGRTPVGWRQFWGLHKRFPGGCLDDSCCTSRFNV